MGLVKYFNDYLSDYKDEFLFCKDRKAVRIAPIKEGQEVFETIENKIISFKAPQNGYQVDFAVSGVRCFFSEEDYRKAKLRESSSELCAYHALKEDVILDKKVVPKGHYIVFQVRDETVLEHPKAYSDQEFTGRFSTLGLDNMMRILRKFAPRP